MGTTAQDFVYTTGANPMLVGSAVTSSPVYATMGPKEAAAVAAADQVAGGSGAATASNSIVTGRLIYDPALTSIPAFGTPHPTPEVYGTALGAFAKNGSVLLALVGTTAQSIDLTNTALNTPAGSAGDTAFATANVLRIKNLGNAAVTISPGASNPSRIPELGGTTPTLTLDAGSEVLFHSAAGQTVDSTHKVITFTPAASTNIAVTISGA